jgi:hypothetical protein
MFSAMNALRFSGLKGAPAAAPMAQPALRFAANNDHFTSVRFGQDPKGTQVEELKDGELEDMAQEAVNEQERQEKKIRIQMLIMLQAFVMLRGKSESTISNILIKTVARRHRQTQAQPCWG